MSADVVGLPVGTGAIKYFTFVIYHLHLQYQAWVFTPVLILTPALTVKDKLQL
jgi:hypothetical protein